MALKDPSVVNVSFFRISGDSTKDYEAPFLEDIG